MPRQEFFFDCSSSWTYLPFESVQPMILRGIAEELVERGGFGSPTMFPDDNDMYFGNDRMPLLDAALARARKREGSQS